MLSVPLPTGRSLTFWVAGAITMVAGFALGNQDLVWPALFLVLLPACMLLAVSLFRPHFTVRRTVDPALQGTMSRNSPFAGRELPGQVVATFLRGRPTVLDGEALAPAGEPAPQGAIA